MRTKRGKRSPLFLGAGDEFGQFCIRMCVVLLSTIYELALTCSHVNQGLNELSALHVLFIFL